MNRQQRRHPPEKTNGGVFGAVPVAVPLLGQRTFICKNGHSYVAPQALRMVLPTTPGQGLQSGPMCFHCYLDALAFAFPAWEQGMTIEEAVAKGALNERVLQGGADGRAHFS